MAGCGSAERSTSPNGDLVALIDEVSWPPNTVWYVKIAKTSLFDRQERTVGCLGDDDPDAGTPTGLRWTSPTQFVITTTGEDVAISITADGSTTVAGNAIGACPDLS